MTISSACASLAASPELKPAQKRNADNSDEEKDQGRKVGGMGERGTAQAKEAVVRERHSWEMKNAPPPSQ